MSLEGTVVLYVHSLTRGWSEADPGHARRRTNRRAKGGRENVSSRQFRKLKEKVDKADQSIRAAAAKDEAELKAMVDDAPEGRRARRCGVEVSGAERQWQEVQSDWDPGTSSGFASEWTPRRTSSTPRSPSMTQSGQARRHRRRQLRVGCNRGSVRSARCRGGAKKGRRHGRRRMTSGRALN